MKEEDIRTRIGELLEEVGLPVSAKERMPEELSGGMQRRVAIARALAAQNPAMFLYDEPTSDLDPVTAERVLGMVDHLAKDGRGFIMVTHEVFHAFKAATRFMLLKDGRFVFDGGRKELVWEENEDIRSFVGDFYWQGLQGFAERQAVGAGGVS
jgi:ABC-type transporter Mla maintaining outer membrane lipid asymmetry ATPase subunit MlaF